MSSETKTYRKKAQKKPLKRRNTSQSAFALEIPDTHPIVASVPKLKPQDLMKLVCKLSLTSGNFIDIKFYAYSRRNATGNVYKPKAIYANSYILRVKSPNYFEPLLQGGYGGYCATGPLHGDFPATFPVECDGEGYDSDSDLEDDDEDNAPGERKAKATHASERAPADPSTSYEEKGKEAERLEGPNDKELSAGDKEEDDDGDFSDPRSAGTIRLIRNFAYPTWNAFMYYLYTEEVTFAPLRSQTQTLKSSDAAQNEVTTPVAPQCSPKSMYSLAHELGLDDLMKLAKNDIQTKLCPDNILTELFSSFTSKYDDIRDMEIEYACQAAKDVVTKEPVARASQA
ncbi:hypothetical protein PHLGIDRAFT_11103 [Phlebiopsis gigantea 11061_1 CR5-6]|uniref:BTB domain-containing protein n=1 Tax=Phlebiopsis gigantea (strain 11061_1 CR5-6) TaxID=745531 RepID=A0A0C3PTI7_PHLG1|nr:hypothetical protein PHLGIDRAFT_11103 [Phlebiopsis gigantea 11061_1 CR5-6]